MKIVKRRLTNAMMMFSVCCFSLAILVFVAEGKASRTYEQFYRDAGLAQGRLIQGSVEAFLRQDVPLRQFAGFNALTNSLLTTESAIAGITILGDRGEEVFTSNDSQADPSSAGDDHANKPATVAQRPQPTRDHVDLPLQNRFEVVGKILILLKLDEMSVRVTDAFQPIWTLVVLASAGFALLTLDAPTEAFERKRPWTAVAFAVTFISVATVIIITLVTLYADGASAKGRALLSSLSGRLDDVTKFELNFDQIEGLDRVFADYRRLNTDISAIALIIDGKAIVHTDRSLIATPWKTPSNTYDYIADISKQGSSRLVQVAMTLPKELVYRQIVDSVRNIFALFVASGFFAYFFMNLARSLQRAQEDRAASQAIRPDVALGLVKPIFFLATFVEHLNYAFLPQYVENIVQLLGIPSGYTSMPFIAYYLCFAAVLIPAGRVEMRFGPKALIWIGLALAACGLLVLIAQLGFTSIVAARALSGVGQGILFIGVQSYILRTTSSDRRTQGASVVVVGFQAGMISGMAIGSLLVAQMGPHGVFGLGAAIAAVSALYAITTIPRMEGHTDQQSQVRMTAWRGIFTTLRDLRFLRTIGLIGLPAKAVLTGVILFALPLLLAKQGFGQEDIGQITMIYAACVVGASAWVSARADRSSHATGSFLVWGAVLSGVGLMVISTLGWKSTALDIGQLLPGTLLIIAGVMIVGVAHGFINAPILTHVTESKLSARLGAGSVVASYRFLERAGHTAGPVIVGQIIAYTGSSLLALGWIGGSLIVLGLLFALSDLGKAEGLEAEIA